MSSRKSVCEEKKKEGWCDIAASLGVSKLKE
jgi:hypothetical protein